MKNLDNLMKLINEVSIWDNGVNKKATILNAYVVNLILNQSATFYYSLSSQNEDGSVDELYAFAFKQSNAHLYGAELNVDIHPHPLDWLHIENSISLIKAQFDQPIDGSKNLPGIPSARWLTELRWTREFSLVMVI